MMRLDLGFQIQLLLYNTSRTETRFCIEIAIKPQAAFPKLTADRIKLNFYCSLSDDRDLYVRCADEMKN